MAAVMGRGRRIATGVADRRTWLERDAPTMRVTARCRCGRALYFCYGITASRDLVVEDECKGGPAVLRCAGCGDPLAACPCVLV